MLNVELIKAWLGRGAYALLLPDGWYGGRPFEGQHKLSSMESSEKDLTIGLDSHLSLAFVNLRDAREGAGELILAPFDKLVFDSIGYGCGTRYPTRIFTEGEVRFVRSFP